MERSRFAIVIPALNEEKTIYSVVSAVNEYGQPIVVDDGSQDDTARKAISAGAIVVTHQFNQGYDRALSSGFNEAVRLRYDFIITIDADGQHDPFLLRSFTEHLSAGFPIVLGVRSSKARLAEHFFAFYTRHRFGIFDPLCGMKAYRRDIFESVGHFDSYGSIGTELALTAIASGANFIQVHFNAKDRQDIPRFGNLISANIKILRALFLWIIK